MKNNKIYLLLLFIVAGLFYGCPSPYEYKPSPFPLIVSLWYNAVSNELYVLKGQRIVVFNNASTANGNVSPARKITATQAVGGIGGPFWVDSTSDQLYITHQGITEPGSILVFDNASTINGDVTPSRVIYP